MKSSFYFLVWILIYRVIDLFHLPNVGEYSFLIAFVFVMFLSYALNRMMPRVISYDRITSTAHLLEDVYNGNVKAFRKRLARQAVVETVTAIYFGLTVAVLLIIIFMTHQYDIFALIIFAFLAVGAIGRSGKLIQANRRLSSEPSPEECARITIDTYNLDYEGFYNNHQNRTLEEMLPPRPAHYNVFLVFSFIIASITTVLGVGFVITSLMTILHAGVVGFGSIATGAMYFLYGSLAAYFGLRDAYSTFLSLRLDREKKDQ